MCSKAFLLSVCLEEQQHPENLTKNKAHQASSQTEFESTFQHNAQVICMLNLILEAPTKVALS